MLLKYTKIFTKNLLIFYLPAGVSYSLSTLWILNTKHKLYKLAEKKLVICWKKTGSGLVLPPFFIPSLSPDGGGGGNLIYSTPDRLRITQRIKCDESIKKSGPFMSNNQAPYNIPFNRVNTFPMHSFNFVSGLWGPAIALIGLSYSPEGNMAFAVGMLTISVGVNAGQYLGYMVRSY